MYKINHSKVKDEGGKLHDTYGISFKNKEIKDICLDKNKVFKLVQLCNKLQVEETQIDDVIEDFLVDYEI